jgi:diguanylate cyclase (GGDEF)-like protein
MPIIERDPTASVMDWSRFATDAAAALASDYGSQGHDALVIVDIDHFRLLNHSHGFRFADAALSSVAQCIRATLGKAHLLGRRGGDEFILLLRRLPQPSDAVEITSALLSEIAQDIEAFDLTAAVTASAGIAFQGRDGADLEELLNAADSGLTQAKQAGGNTYGLQSPSAAREAEVRVRLRHHMSRGLQPPAFWIELQPVMDIRSRQTRSLEVFIRWTDEILGAVTPSEFIPVADQQGDILRIGAWVLDQVLAFRKSAKAQGLDPAPCSLNMTARELANPTLAETLCQRLAEQGIEPNEIEIELSELGQRVATLDLTERLTKLRNAGFRIILDDFGAGFASPVLAKDMPISAIKIDRHLTVDCMRDARTLTVVKATVEMANQLGMEPIAEGVDTEAQLTWMTHLGCVGAQGFLFRRPMTVRRTLDWLTETSQGRDRSVR